MITVIPNIAAVADQESQGKRLYNKIYIVLDDDVDYGELPEITINEEARTMAALTLKEGAKWAEINFAKFTGQRTSEGSAGDVTTAVTNTLTGTLGGLCRKKRTYRGNRPLHPEEVHSLSSVLTNGLLGLLRT